MEELQALENFEAVWRRVRGEDAPLPRKKQAEGLPALLEAQYRQMRLYSMLSRRCRDGLRRELERLYAEEKRHYRRTEMEYFLRTGLRYLPEGDCPAVAAFLEGLRMAWQREAEMQGLFSATEDGGEDWRRDARSMASEDESHEKRLYALIRRKMLG